MGVGVGGCGAFADGCSGGIRCLQLGVVVVFIVKMFVKVVVMVMQVFNVVL